MEKEEKLILEETHNDDIGTADFSFDKLVKTFQEVSSASLIREIAVAVPMKYSTGKIVNIRKQAANDSFETVSANLTVNTATSNPIQTGLSLEAVADLQNQYGLDGYTIASNLLKGIVDAAENTAFMTFLDTNSLSTTALTLSDANSAEPSLFEITQRVQELVIKMNTPNFRTFNAFCVLPYKNAASISALSQYARGDEETKKNLVMSTIGQTHYYVNPDTSATTAFVGLKAKDKKSMGASSVIMGTFAQEILKSTHVESFQAKVGILNRYATAVNPLSDTGAEMLMKFTIS